MIRRAVVCCALLCALDASAQPAESKPEEPKPEEPKPEEPKPEEPKPDKPEPEEPDEPDDVRDPDADPKAEKAQAKSEKRYPRTALPDVKAPEPPPWGRRLEIGASFAFVLRPFAGALADSQIAYQPAPGFGVHIHWEIFRWLRLHPYFVQAFHGLDIPPGALQSGTATSISPDAVISEESVSTFTFGAKIAPTYPFTDRLRAWVSAGVGWGRFEFPAMTVTDPDGSTYEIRRRSGSLVEFPLGVGVAFDVIEHWLSIEYEATAAPITGQSGDAYQIFQTIDASGALRDVGPFGAIDASFVQTLGVSLIL